jgi:hypothetical protein
MNLTTGNLYLDLIILIIAGVAILTAFIINRVSTYRGWKNNKKN